MKNKKLYDQVIIPSICLFVLAFMPMTVQAVDCYWTNASGDGIYTNTANWNPNALPQTTDYTADVVIFGTQGGTPTTVTRINYSNPSWVSDQNMLHVKFDTAGWTFTSTTIKNLKTLKSYGLGTNTVDFYWEQKDNQTWLIGEGNMLYLAKSFYARGQVVTLTGGGTVYCSAPFGGYSSGSFGIKVKGVTLKINGTTPSSAAGVVWIDSQEARFQLKTSVTAAKNLIGSKVFDNVGFGLKVTDVGGGYVEFSAKVLGTLIVVQ